MDKINSALLYTICFNNYLISILQNKKKSKRRRWWVSKMYRNRTRDFMEKMFSDLRTETSIQFFKFFQMSANDYEYLLNKIGPIIAKEDTKFRKSIPAKVRLAVALRYLATGDSFRSLQHLFKISHQIISKILIEACEALISTLQDEVKLPTTQEEWLNIENGFKLIFPHCIGALAGKYVMNVSESIVNDLSNEANSFNLILLALVDSNFCFLFADVKCRNKINNDDILNNCLLSDKLNNNHLNLPAPSMLPGRTEKVPYIFVADNAFQLQTNIMIPFSNKHSENIIEKKFNTHLNRARLFVSNTFGIMSTIFKVLKKPICLKSERASKVVMTCILLHNFLIKSKTSGNIYNPPGFSDSFKNNNIIPGSWRNESQKNKILRPLPSVDMCLSQTSLEIRREFASYFFVNS